MHFDSPLVFVLTRFYCTDFSKFTVLYYLGALIGIDYAWALLETKKFRTPNQVFEIVRNMRLQRPAMVQTKDQYVLVYNAIFQLVRQYLDEYQHDPSVAHLFDLTIKDKLSKITLPVYQNPSGIGEDVVNVELGGEINEDELLSPSGKNLVHTLSLIGTRLRSSRLIPLAYTNAFK